MKRRTHVAKSPLCRAKMARCRTNRHCQRHRPLPPTNQGQGSGSGSQNGSERQDAGHQTQKQRDAIESITDAIERQYEDVRQKQRRESTQQKWDRRQDQNQRDRETSRDVVRGANGRELTGFDRIDNQLNQTAQRNRRDRVQSAWDRRRERNERFDNPESKRRREQGSCQVSQRLLGIVEAKHWPN